jgi:acyl-CoA thioester hydrolase
VAKPYTVEIQVRFRDVDMMGHVNNAVYLTYMETARTDYYLVLAAKKVLPKPGEFDWIVARAEIDFRDAAKLGETIAVTVWPSRIGNSSWDFSYRLAEKGSKRVFAEAKTVQVAYDYDKGKPKALDPAMRRGLESAMKAAQAEGLATDAEAGASARPGGAHGSSRVASSR